jgi:hypothetical protein
MELLERLQWQVRLQYSGELKPCHDLLFVSPPAMHAGHAAPALRRQQLLRESLVATVGAMCSRVRHMAHVINAAEHAMEQARKAKRSKVE